MQDHSSTIDCEQAVDSLRRPTLPRSPAELESMHTAVDAVVAIAGLQLTDMGLRPAAAWGAFRPAIFGYAYGAARSIVADLQLPHLEAEACLQATSRLVHGELEGRPVSRVNELANCFEREDASFFAALEAGEEDGANWRSRHLHQGLMASLARSTLVRCQPVGGRTPPWRSFAGAMGRVAAMAAVLAGMVSLIPPASVASLKAAPPAPALSGAGVAQIDSASPVVAR